MPEDSEQDFNYHSVWYSFTPAVSVEIASGSGGKCTFTITKSFPNTVYFWDGRSFFN